jgi:hypothetical protein
MITVKNFKKRKFAQFVLREENLFLFGIAEGNDKNYKVVGYDVEKGGFVGSFFYSRKKLDKKAKIVNYND